ncbi:4718_t:CDS:2 [Paraglomus occultum]|uniref:4718_t:CDS:1 n=1 Tax=Paraglomus occultum TaxID=144539 RepID=A0A9N9C318_9GLOM|nr:4718_t:CDS:2 [Paraglomus occultum]
MTLSELQCGVCKELKPNPREAQCCHKLFCRDCIKSLRNAERCPACGANASFRDNVFATRMINSKLTTIGRRASTDSKSDMDIFGAFPITILTLTGKKMFVVVEKSDTVNILKLKIEQKDGTPPEYQRLIFLGKQLENHLTISNYKIESGVTVHMVERSKSG